MDSNGQWYCFCVIGRKENNIMKMVISFFLHGGFGLWLVEVIEQGITNLKPNTLFFSCIQSKCEKYWPDNGTKTYRDIRVMVKERHHQKYFCKRQLKFSKVCGKNMSLCNGMV
jgi:hypothetical protein